MTRSSMFLSSLVVTSVFVLGGAIRSHAAGAADDTIGTIEQASSDSSTPATTVPSNKKKSFSESEIRALKSNFAKFGVSEDDGDRLIMKMETGTLVDSMQGNNDPIKVDQIYIDGNKTVISRFADASYTAVAVETPRQVADSLTARVPGCTEYQSAGVKYANNCTVAYSGVSYSYGFKANYSYWSRGSSVSAIEGSTFGHVIAGGYGFNGFTYSDSPKSVRGSFAITFGGVATLTFFAKLTVTTGGASVSSY